MIIECPGCQETYEVDMPSIAPDGIEINCKNCSRRFLIRPHGAPSSTNGPSDEGRAASSPVDSEIRDLSVPPKTVHADTDFNESVFLQQEEIPYSIVQAYEAIASREALPTFEEDAEAPLPLNAHEDRHGEQAELFLDPDGAVGTDGLEGLAEGLANDDYFSTPYPLGKDLVVGRKRSGSRLRLWIGGGLAAVVVVALALLVGKCTGKESWQRMKEFGQGALSLFPFHRLESGRIQISDLNGTFQDRAGKGSAVFVIEGNVTNRHSSPCHSIQVKGTLFDERGNPSVEGVVYCGNVLTPQQIKSHPRKKIEKTLQNTYGETLSNFNVEPGKSVPFMLIFFDPPGKLSEFSVEVHEYTLQEPTTP
jgi:predicted Zn finger-like uncharacterized protein